MYLTETDPAPQARRQVVAPPCGAGEVWFMAAAGSEPTCPAEPGRRSCAGCPRIPKVESQSGAGLEYLTEGR